MLSLRCRRSRLYYAMPSIFLPHLSVRMDPSEPVYYAHRSTCLFELGKYAASCEDSKQASLLYRDKQQIGMISRSEANAAIARLLRQSARAFLCVNTPHSLQAAKALLARTIELHPDPDAELLSMQAGACQAVAEADSATAGEGSGPGYMVQSSSKHGRGCHLGIGGGSCDYLPRYRSPVVNGPTPYSCIGWELGLSGLAGRVPSPADTESPFSAHGGTFGEDEDDGGIDLLARPEGERDLALLFGGLGDARQPLATFRDIYQQVKGSKGQLTYKTMSLSMILNDVKAECLTRAVIMFKALAELGIILQEAAREQGIEWGMEGVDEGVAGTGSLDPLALLESSDAVAEAVYRCYHLYLGAFLMPNEADWLQRTLNDMSKSNSLTQASRLPGSDHDARVGSSPPLASTPSAGPSLLDASQSSTPFQFSSNLGFSWLRIKAKKDREAVKNVVDHWRVLCKTMGADVMARIYQSSMQRPTEEEDEGGLQTASHDQGGGTGGGARADAMEESNLSLEQQWRAQVREAMLEQIEAMDDEEINQMREAEGATPEEKRAFLRDHWAEDVDPRTLDLMRHLPAAHREIDFFHTTMLLPVPTPEAARGMGLMDKSQGRNLHNTWRPNVTLVSADIPMEAMLPGKLDKAAVASSSLTELHFCPFKALKLLLIQPGDENHLARQEAFRSAALFFSEVALGLAGFLEAGTLKMQMFLGDVHDLGSTRAPNSLDRVLISNVPDYTTLLPSMIKLIPLLKTSPGSALKHSVLKFNANFQDLPEYAHSMGLYVPDMACLPTYLGVNHEYGGIWAHLIEWSRAPPLLLEGPGEESLHLDMEKDESTPHRTSSPAPFTTPLPPTQHLPSGRDVQAWLSTVFLSIAMPLCRDCVLTHTEIRPLTLQAFFELCHYLVAHMDFPPHNLAWVIEHAMIGELTTAAVPPDKTPWLPQYTWRQQQLSRAVPTGAFSLEMRTLAGLWQPKLGFRLCAPVGHRLPRPEDVTQLRLTVPWRQQLPCEGRESAEALAVQAESCLKATGVPLAKVVGAVLVSPAFLATHAEAFDPSNHYVQMPPHGCSHTACTFSSSPSKTGHEPHPTPENQGLRPLLLAPAAQKSGDVHLFSCVRWDSRTSLVTLLMPKDDLRQLVARSFHLCLLRTDSWQPLTKPFPLSDDPALLRPHIHAHMQEMQELRESEIGEAVGETTESAMDVEVAEGGHIGAYGNPAETGRGMVSGNASLMATAEERSLHKYRTY